MSQTHAVVTDLDGTVVRADGTVSPDTLAAAAALRARGIPLVAATARTPAGLRALEPLVPYLSLAVCCSGALGYHPGDDRAVWREHFTADAVARLLAGTAVHLPGAGLAAYDGSTWFLTPQYRAIRVSGHRGPTELTAHDALRDVDACAFAVCHPDLGPQELIGALRAAGVDQASASLSQAGTLVVEVTPAGIDKASGVRRALDVLGVAPDRAIAFGDMPVDIPMFGAVGLGVAMADAHPAVLAAAGEVTGSVADDGFARCLERLRVVGPLR